jgi:hypothetical protein
MKKHDTLKEASPNEYRAGNSTRHAEATKRPADQAGAMVANAFPIGSCMKHYSATRN